MNNNIYQDMEIQEIDDYTVMIGFDIQWLTFVAQIHKADSDEYYSESGHTKEETLERSIDLINLLKSS